MVGGRGLHERAWRPGGPQPSAARPGIHPLRPLESNFISKPELELILVNKYMYFLKSKNKQVKHIYLVTLLITFRHVVSHVHSLLGFVTFFGMYSFHPTTHTRRRSHLPHALLPPQCGPVRQHLPGHTKGACCWRIRMPTADSLTGHAPFAAAGEMVRCIQCANDPHLHTEPA